MSKREKTRKVYVVLPVRQIESLQRQADRQSRTFSSVLREAIQEYTGIEDTVQLGGVRSKDDSDEGQPAAEPAHV